MDELIEQIRIVAKAREDLQALQEIKKARLAEWEETNSLLLEDISLATVRQSESEANLRDLTIKAYQETGNKTPAPGVGIREVTKLEYDAKEAFNWAVEHKIMLKLDAPAFEKMAKMAPETRPGFVKIHTDPQATIATDLSKVLQEVE